MCIDEYNNINKLINCIISIYICICISCICVCIREERGRDDRDTHNYS